MGITKLLIANRGEIAVRIIRAAKEMGIRTVQVHSAADAGSLAVEMADEAIEIGPPPASKSYLNIAAILDAARQSGADGIHPGYGFLAENADFADAVEAAGIAFVGPTGDMIRAMGDKASARRAAQKAGVPTVPGSDGVIGDLAEAARSADEIGYPVMIKATAGGGGRGIRVAENARDFANLAPQAAAEAKSAFGDGGLYLEKLIARARHIEVQILGDGTNFVHCFERECSLQRRRQKVWEEAPSMALTDAQRADLCMSAVALAQAVKYRGAGTVEYLYDDETGAFYFIEMNTRIQVEHPVTECVTGLDLVAEMIAIAGGKPLSVRQEDIQLRGHAIEVRINAEDPANNFAPFPGIVDGFRAPGGPGVRFDHMLYDGYQIPPFYDSLLGKLIVTADDRPAAITRLKRAVGELRTGGLKTTAPLFLALAEDADVQAGNYHTKWLEPWLAEHAGTFSDEEGT
ncbi:acetyl-CoA carboxylase biotin carboxylase subunit [Sulfitobacter sp. PR48]|uniref:acetyl-CoA carboxylase biotin carboxylase subunit n=1 Tax=unclassified Sulfitobacter TaxID=196795 RepID=UPI0022AFDEBE|nr:MULTISPECIES: acetyl-CoA carboxylase biotin carboxylase subunit [unclassified Sulfitobacter]MCZ4255196.1 acetyl-CoA carboxylase biotin carboxylase subunit [Sulfitobacter sp. G21635-S1]MDD9720562.1 acetyl-CoA carboxylase biotin carboxylase subunit [Sulfitobacter sp. PR48]